MNKSTAYTAFEQADHAWQAEINKRGLYRYSQAAQGVKGSKLAALYEARREAMAVWESFAFGRDKKM